MSRVCAISIYVKELHEATKFYSEVMDLKVKKELPYLVLLDHDGADLVLCPTEDPAAINYPNQSAVVLGFQTKNLGERIKELQAKGVALIHSTPQDFPGGNFVAFRDPSGNVHELLEFNQ
jgi:predicted enzyme related to lactoylglutathione lyase